MHTTGINCRDTLPCTNMALKLPQYFLPADGEASWLLLPSLVSVVSGGIVQPEKDVFLYPQGDKSGLRKPKKDKHQHKS